MDLTPDDLPEDPYGHGGMAQLFCVCTGELFKFIFTELTVRAICAQCGQVAGEYPRTSSPIASIENATGVKWAQLPPAEDVGPGRDMLGHRAHTGAAWDTPPPGVPQPTEPIPPGELPALPSFSFGLCNAYLSGGPYDGQITWLMPGATTFAITGMTGVYQRTAEVRDDRPVYAYQE